MVKIGQLRNRLVFQKDTKVSDGEGGYTTTKSTDFTLWGSLRQMSEREVFGQGQETGFNTYEIWVHYQSDMIPTRQHLIVCGLNTFTINGINEIEDKNRWFKITATRNG